MLILQRYYIKKQDESQVVLIYHKMLAYNFV